MVMEVKNLLGYGVKKLNMVWSSKTCYGEYKLENKSQKKIRSATYS